MAAQIKLKVVPELRPGQHVTFELGKGALAVHAPGPIEYVCGSCGDVIAKGTLLGDANTIAHCSCGAYNAMTPEGL